ncbi:MAG TPA: hydrogenase maturation protease [Lutibacter sp.]|nr:hydrogenase maturation protease [Lutibacter sp.]
MELQKLFYQTHDYINSDKKDQILVLGIGNYLMGDEGVGVHAIQALSKEKLSKNVDLIDGGTGSFDLMPILAQYPLVVFIDATMDGKVPGTINVIYPKFAADFPKVLSAHDVGLKDMIDALEFKEELPKIILLTVSIKEMIPMTIELSKEVQTAIPNVVSQIKSILNEILK